MTTWPASLDQRLLVLLQETRAAPSLPKCSRCAKWPDIQIKYRDTSVTFHASVWSHKPTNSSGHPLVPWQTHSNSASVAKGLCQGIVLDALQRCIFNSLHFCHLGLEASKCKAHAHMLAVFDCRPAGQLLWLQSATTSGARHIQIAVPACALLKIRGTCASLGTVDQP